jgi:small subunit ribosomal protein S17
MKTFVGTVIRSTTPKTVFVQVESLWMHPVYKKKKKVTSTFACHDTVGVSVGDSVKIGEIRPMSKTKKFTIVEKVSEK